MAPNRRGRRAAGRKESPNYAHAGHYRAGRSGGRSLPRARDRAVARQAGGPLDGWAGGGADGAGRARTGRWGAGGPGARRALSRCRRTHRGARRHGRAVPACWAARHGCPVRDRRAALRVQPGAAGVLVPGRRRGRSRSFGPALPAASRCAHRAVLPRRHPAARGGGTRPAGRQAPFPRCPHRNGRGRAVLPAARPRADHHHADLYRAVRGRGGAADARPSRRAGPARPVPAPAPGYRPEVLATLLGTPR